MLPIFLLQVVARYLMPPTASPADVCHGGWFLAIDLLLLLGLHSRDDVLIPHASWWVQRGYIRMDLHILN
jgi:hypothetical protein